jgi:hypothetical protein
MKLRIRAMAMAVGVVSGLAVFFASVFSLWMGSGETIDYLRWVLPGFQRTYVGAFVGLIGGFAWGFVLGGLLAWSYNRFFDLFYKLKTTD